LTHDPSAGVGGWFRSRDEHQVVAGKAEPRSPVQAVHLDVGAAGSPKAVSVSACTGVINDAHPPSGAKHSHSFAQCLGAFFLAVDVGEGEVALAFGVGVVRRRRHEPPP
jgi:hypothetical protein